MLPHPEARGVYWSGDLADIELKFPTRTEAHTLASWAVYESKPSTKIDKRKESVIVIAVSTCKRIHFFTMETAGRKVDVDFEKFESRESDCMAIAFDQAGDTLYCGLRSGAVLALRWKRSRNGRALGRSDNPFKTLLDSGASVTNLGVCFELRTRRCSHQWRGRNGRYLG